MVQVLSRRSTIAWFKLAEFVERKEKERALAIYRLLIHSLSDPAYIAQLEGDLLAAFHDERATESYRRAALVYEKTDRFFAAALAHEQIALLSCCEQSLESWKRAYELYQLIGNTARALQCVNVLSNLAATAEHISLSNPVPSIKEASL